MTGMINRMRALVTATTLMMLLLLCSMPISASVAHADSTPTLSATSPAAGSGSAALVDTATLPAAGSAAVGAVVVAPRAAAVDPIDTSTASVESAWGSIEKYGPLWGLQLLLYSLGVAFLRRNADKQWLVQGRVLSLITTGLMMLGAILTWKFRGGDTAGLLMSLFLAIKMLVSPKPADTVAKKQEDDLAKNAATIRLPQLGSARLGMVLGLSAVLGIAIMATSCTRLQNDVESIPGAAKDAIVDCAKADAGGIASLLTQLSVDFATYVLNTGTPDWDRLVSDAVSQGKVLGGCALAEFVAKVEAADQSQQTPAQSTSTSASLVANSSASLVANSQRKSDVVAGGHGAMSKFKSAVSASSAKFKLASGATY